MNFEEIGGEFLNFWIRLNIWSKCKLFEWTRSENQNFQVHKSRESAVLLKTYEVIGGRKLPKWVGNFPIFKPSSKSESEWNNSNRHHQKRKIFWVCKGQTNPTNRSHWGETDRTIATFKTRFKVWIGAKLVEQTRPKNVFFLRKPIVGELANWGPK